MPVADGTRQRKNGLVKVAAMVALLIPLAAGAQISLSTAVNLAEQNSPSVRAAAADVKKATAGLAEAKDAYIPNFVVGASPGYAYGYPLGYPSFFSANSQSLMLSFSQPDYIRAARAAVNAANLSLKDAQQQVALDIALDYVELDHDLEEISALNQEMDYAGSLVQIEQQRVLAGVDARVTELQAELTAAQVDEKRIHLENDADEMRQKISHLTGLPATGLMTVSNSIPPAPTFSVDTGNDLAENNPGVSAADANAKSKLYTAFGDERQNYRPLITFGAQYSLFQKFAGYTEYFHGFQYNNVALGIQVTFPFFDAARRAKARETAADARHAQADADAARNTFSEETLAMRRSILELNAQQRVAQIQSELAQEQLKSVETELSSGTGSAAAPPATPIQAQQAHIQERERYEDLLDAQFALIKVQLSLLRQTGQIGNWVQSSLK